MSQAEEDQAQHPAGVPAPEAATARGCAVQLDGQPVAEEQGEDGVDLQLPERDHRPPDGQVRGRVRLAPADVGVLHDELDVDQADAQQRAATQAVDESVSFGLPERGRGCAGAGIAFTHENRVCK